MTLNDLKTKYHLTPQEIREAIDAGFTMDDMLDLYKADIIERQNAALESEDFEQTPAIQPIGVPKANGKPATPVLPAVLPPPVAAPKKRGRPSNAAKTMAQTAVQNVIPQQPLQLPNGIKVNRNAVYRNQVAKVQAAIQYLRQFNTPSPKGITSKGIHVVYSHFNEIMPAKLGVTNVEPTWELRALLTLMAERGDIGLEPRRGGPMIYLPGESPAKSGVSLSQAEQALANL